MDTGTDKRISQSMVRYFTLFSHIIDAGTADNKRRG